MLANQISKESPEGKLCIPDAETKKGNSDSKSLRLNTPSKIDTILEDNSLTKRDPLKSIDSKHLLFTDNSIHDLAQKQLLEIHYINNPNFLSKLSFLKNNSNNNSLNNNSFTSGNNFNNTLSNELKNKTQKKQSNQVSELSESPKISYSKNEDEEKIKSENEGIEIEEDFFDEKLEKEEIDSVKNSEENFCPDIYKNKNTHKKKYKTCGNKSCKTETGGWALKFTRVKSENNGYIMLCINCAKAHRKGQFCFYCKQIYLDNDDDGKDWIQCDFCKKWVHVDCEQTQEPKIKTLMNSKEFLYYCPKCKFKLKNKPTTLKRPKKELDERLFAKFRPKKAIRTSENNHQALIARMHKQSGEEYLDPFVKESKLNNEESNNFENLNINKNNALDDLNNFCELAFFKNAAVRGKQANNDSGYNGIDTLMNNYGIKLALTENEILLDLNYSKGLISTRIEEKQEESKIMQIENTDNPLPDEENESFTDNEGKIEISSEHNSKVNEENKKKESKKKSNHNNNYGLRKGLKPTQNQIKSEILEENNEKTGRILRNRKK